MGRGNPNPGFGHPRDNQMPVWSPDGRLLATIAPGSVLTGERAVVKVWEVAFPTPTYLLHAPIDSLSFSLDGKRLAVHGRIWEVAEDHDRPASVALVAQDGKQLGRIRRRRPALGRQLASGAFQAPAVDPSGATDFPHRSERQGVPSRN